MLEKTKSEDRIYILELMKDRGDISTEQLKELERLKIDVFYSRM